MLYSERGITLLLTLIIQSCIITIITFFSIFFIATKIFKLDPRFGVTLGGGGSICGVSAAIVIGNAAKAKQEYISATISIVVFWAVLMILFSYLSYVNF
ncbi:putative sulfate exporter family transporter [Campylobacter lari]|uniref:putative sulfate exporter family transporter n=1 Tax=Campylobacter lari TaxID=201 RepID=UPI0012850245|nr:putative sulfate exporter family transporter [Campylobacter lari]EAJ5701911.1 putative sulfate exporter family transporter [Campylobacter lari]EAK2603086.1 putative sulfate exporter family transporter [Campylobacter lari]EAK5890362.1 putative sulfate exporter family transporter [Campylobacter lari]EGK8039115.1 putative sulfate exporter family transporter [Campylobacter lari]